MKFFVQSSLFYSIQAPSTIFGSIRCMQTGKQSISEENLWTDRPVHWENLDVGLAENQMSRFDIASPGPLTIQYEAVADIQPEFIFKTDVHDDGVKSIPAAYVPYLYPSRYAPSDRFRAVATDLFGAIGGKLNQALAVEQWLWERIQYIPGTSDETSSAIETLERREGVCRDFAHLGIAFCRALSIPARYVTVYAFQLHPQDYHAVFEVLIGNRWYLMDGTRRAPLNGMIRISMGRDATDAAIASLFGLIQGDGFTVSTLLGKDEVNLLQPIFRGDLERGHQVISLV